MKRKRRMLEDEGVLFERDGAVDKVCEQFFKCKRDSSTICTRNADPRKKKRAKNTEKNDDDEASKHQIMSPRQNSTKDVTEDELKEEILCLLQKRSPGKTC